MRHLGIYLLSFLFTISLGFSNSKKKEAVKFMEVESGAGLSLNYSDLSEHEALKVSFTVHFVGPWDGTCYGNWSPDRFFCKIDSKTVLDSTFNNCHLVFVDNIWQSFPDPHHEDQLDCEHTVNPPIDGTYLYHGGHGAVAVASLGHKWSSKSSVDSSYKFCFTVQHAKDSATLKFGTIWKETPESTSTYKIEGVEVEALKKTPALNLKKENMAWRTFFAESADASQQAWQKIYATHPENFIERVSAMVAGDEQRKNYLVEQISQGYTPTECLFRDVDYDINAKDLRQQINRVLCLRELALGRKFFSSEERSEIRNATDLSWKMKSLRKVNLVGFCMFPIKKCIPLQRARMRIYSYLKMINTEESIKLADKLIPPDIQK